MSLRASLILWAAPALAIPAAPAIAQKVDYDGRFPAKNREAARLLSVGVLAFNGPDGANFTSALVGALQSSMLDGKPYFAVKTIEGMNYAPPPPPRSRRGRPAPAPSAQRETAMAIALGRRLGVQAVYLGEVAQAVYSRRDYMESRTVCENNGGKKCKSVQQQVPCRETALNYVVTPRLINVATGQIVYSRTVSAKDDYTLCAGELKIKGTLADTATNFFKGLGSQFRRTKDVNPNEKKSDVPDKIASDPDLETKVRVDAAKAIRYDVSPYNFITSVEFKPRAPEMPPADQAKFKIASDFAKAKRVDRACSDWESLNTPANASSINLLFNRGVCSEVLVPEDPAAAADLLSKADGLTTKPDPINKALLRVRAMTDGQTEISRQVRK